MENSVAGKLLVAMPGIGDPRFERAVILLCMHTDDAAMGLIVNKPRDDIRVSDVLEHLGVPARAPLQAQAVLAGGPVKPDRGFVLHSTDFESAEGSQDVAPGVRLSATRDALEAFASPTPPADFALALGYSGWGAGQLERELAANAWLVADPAQAIIFGLDHGGKWEAAIRSLGVDPAMLSTDMGRA